MEKTSKNNFIIKWLYENRFVLLAFLLAALLMNIVYMVKQIFPYGIQTILKVDLYHQYGPFHEEFRSRILNGQSLFYSWQGSLGKNFVAQAAYYTASPVSLLMLFFKQNYMPEAMALFILIKIAFSAAFAALYIKKHYEKNDFSIVFFALMYAFMSFMTGFYWNVMWLDAVALFPIVALGIESLVKDGKFMTYAIALAVVIFVNFYIAFMVCIFAALYYIVVLFSDYTLKHNFKIIKNRTILFAAMSILAGGMAMVLMLPTAIALSETATSESTFPGFAVYQNIWQVLTNHFIGARPVVLGRNEDLPNIYTGLLTIMLLPYYYLDKQTKVREKTLFSALLIFMLLCCCIKPMDFAIHGMHFPSNLPHRFTFIYSFILITMAYKAFLRFRDDKKLKFEYLFIICGIYTAWMCLTEFVFVSLVDKIERTLTNQDILINIGAMAAYVVMLYFYKDSAPKGKHKFSKNVKAERFNFTLPNCIFGFIVCSLLAFGIIFTIYKKSEGALGIKAPSTLVNYAVVIVALGIVVFGIMYLIGRYKPADGEKTLAELSPFLYKLYFVMLIFVFCEMLFGAITGLDRTTERSKYMKFTEAANKAVEYERKNSDEFYRSEFHRFTAINEGALYHYPGFSQFSSMAPGDTTALVRAMGVAATSNSQRYYDPTPLVDAVFNVKYVMFKDGDVTKMPDRYKYINTFEGSEEESNVTLYQNDDCLPLGFMTNSNITDWMSEDAPENTQPFDVQNDFIHKATGIEEDMFTNIELDTFNYNYLEITKALNTDEDDYVKIEDSAQPYKIGDSECINLKYSLTDPANLNLHPSVSASVKFTAPQYVYFYVDAGNTKKVTFDKNGTGSQTRELSTGRSLFDVGQVSTGDTLNISFELTNKGEFEKTYRKTGDIKIYVASYNEDVFKKAYNELSQNPLTVPVPADDTVIDGTVNVTEEGVLFTSIPYDTGWKLTVDGEKAEYIPIGGNGLIGVRLSPGSHTLRFKYTPRGFFPGLAVSIISIAVFAVICIINRKRQFQNTAGQN